MKKIKCKCGNTIMLDYARAGLLDEGYSWNCKACGQSYHEKVKSSIKITDKMKHDKN